MKYKIPIGFDEFEIDLHIDDDLRVVGIIPDYIVEKYNLLSKKVCSYSPVEVVDQIKRSINNIARLLISEELVIAYEFMYNVFPFMEKNGDLISCNDVICNANFFESFNKYNAYGNGMRVALRFKRIFGDGRILYEPVVKSKVKGFYEKQIHAMDMYVSEKAKYVESSDEMAKFFIEVLNTVRKSVNVEYLTNLIEEKIKCGKN